LKGICYCGKELGYIGHGKGYSHLTCNDCVERIKKIGYSAWVSEVRQKMTDK
jgi:hypothetical protein